jgi:CMP-2-keto-3-deoxyoctulosonic acid synthetase
VVSGVIFVPKRARNSIEQLCALENGLSIRVVIYATDSVAVYTSCDLRKAAALMGAWQKSSSS